jgi:threonine dehydratase
VLRTPLRRSEWLSTIAGGHVSLKLESLQPTFSYKLRGAFNAVLKLAQTEVRSPKTEVREVRGAPALVTASAGNHGRAMAHAAAAVGLRLTVYVPAHAPRTKLDAIRRAGAELRTCADYDEAERQAKEHAARGEGLFISPYSHPDVIAGAGTIGLEILEDDPTIDTIVVAIGGGGLISGIAIAAHELNRGRTAVIGVEAQASTPFTQGLAAGRIVPVDVRPTLADGLAGNLDPDTITFDLVRKFVQRVVTVSDETIGQAMRGLAVEEKLVTEGAGAAAVAALLARELDLRDRRTAVVISGGNVDPEVLKSIL